MIIELLGLAALAAASSSDLDQQRKRMAAELAMGQVPNLNALIKARGLKWVADRINALPDEEPGAPSPRQELLLRGLERWVGRDVHVPTSQEAWAQYHKDIKGSIGAIITVFESELGGIEANGGVSSIHNSMKPIRVRVRGLLQPEVELSTNRSGVIYAYWETELIGPTEHGALTRRLLEAFWKLQLHGPSYQVP